MTDSQMEILAASSLFQGVDRVQHREFAKIFEVKQFAAGDIVFREGDLGDAVYVLGAGAVRLTKALPDGSSAVICQLGEGETLGEMALISHAPRSATATFLDDGNMWVLTREKFNALEKLDVRLWAYVVKSLAALVCDRLNNMNGEVATFLHELETLRADAKRLEQEKTGLFSRLFGRG